MQSTWWMTDNDATALQKQNTLQQSLNTKSGHGAFALLTTSMRWLVTLIAYLQQLYESLNNFTEMTWWRGNTGFIFQGHLIVIKLKNLLHIVLSRILGPSPSRRAFNSSHRFRIPHSTSTLGNVNGTPNRTRRMKECCKARMVYGVLWLTVLQSVW